MNTAKKAENHVKNCFKENLNVDLEKPRKKERGFDFRNPKSNSLIEVKGTTKELSDVQFRYFTKDQHKKAKECVANGKKYEIHLVVGIGRSMAHYKIPVKAFTEKAKKETQYRLPIGKGIKEGLKKICPK